MADVRRVENRLGDSPHGQHAAPSGKLEIARLVADFLGAAKQTLDLAQYDFNLGPETREIVAGALTDAAARAVAVRIIYNVDHENPIPVPPPPEPDVALISTLGVPARA